MGTSGLVLDEVYSAAITALHANEPLHTLLHLLESCGSDAAMLAVAAFALQIDPQEVGSHEHQCC